MEYDWPPVVVLHVPGDLVEGNLASMETTAAVPGKGVVRFSLQTQRRVRFEPGDFGLDHLFQTLGDTPAKFRKVAGLENAAVVLELPLERLLQFSQLRL